ncbi:unnamed protein product [Rhizophagus irregularis]|nr:unnamed protein product [Rhizophagus irregularis]
MPPFRQQKQRRLAISDEVKRQICEWGKANKNKRHVDIVNHFNKVYPNLTIDRSTISKILLQSDKWTAIINTEDSSKTFRHKAVKFLILDQAMNLWVENVTAGGVILTDLYHIHGESESAPLASLPEERTKLQQLLSRYTLDQIYNIDETGLFYRMSPSQTLSTKPVPGRKKDKTRITVLLGANATGTDKLKP